MRFTRVGAAMAALTALALSGCAAPDGGGADAAAGGGGDGSLTFICSPQEDLCQAVTQQFTADTGIPANYVRLSAGESFARLNASKGNPEFDVWYGSGAEGHVVASRAELTEPYLSPSAEPIPAEYKDAEGAWTGIYVGALGFCSNTDVLDRLGLQPPTSWDDLLDPRYAANVAMAHPGTSGTALQVLRTQAELNDDDMDAAMGYFTRLNNNILQYSKSGSAPGQMAGRGEIATGIVFAQDCQKFILEGFDNLTISYPREGVGYEIGAVSMVRGAKNPDAARAFIDWSLTPQAQDIAPTAGTYALPTHPDATVTPDMVQIDEITLLDEDVEQVADERDELISRFDAEIAPLPRD